MLIACTVEGSTSSRSGILRLGAPRPFTRKTPSPSKSPLGTPSESPAQSWLTPRLEIQWPTHCCHTRFAAQRRAQPHKKSGETTVAHHCRFMPRRLQCRPRRKGSFQPGSAGRWRSQRQPPQPSCLMPCRCAVARNQSRSSTDQAPPFATIAARPDFDAGKLTLFLRDPHPKMPDMSLTRSEAADLAAYIGSLKK